MSMAHYFYIVNKVETQDGDVIYKKWNENPTEIGYDNISRLKELDYLIRSCDTGDKIDIWFDWIASDQVSKDLAMGLGFTDGDVSYTQFSVLDLDTVKSKQMQYVKTGYFLTRDVDAYINEDEYVCDDLFYDRLSPEVYASKLLAEAKMSKDIIKAKIEDGEYMASDYMYFAYPDYASVEYVVAFAREIVKLFDIKNACLLHFLA